MLSSEKNKDLKSASGNVKDFAEVCEDSKIKKTAFTLEIKVSDNTPGAEDRHESNKAAHASKVKDDIKFRDAPFKCPNEPDAQKYLVVTLYVAKRGSLFKDKVIKNTLINDRECCYPQNSKFILRKLYISKAKREEADTVLRKRGISDEISGGNDQLSWTAIDKCSFVNAEGVPVRGFKIIEKVKFVVVPFTCSSVVNDSNVAAEAIRPAKDVNEIKIENLPVEVIKFAAVDNFIAENGNISPNNIKFVHSFNLENEVKNEDDAIMHQFDEVPSRKILDDEVVKFIVNKVAKLLAVDNYTLIVLAGEDEENLHVKPSKVKLVVVNLSDEIASDSSNICVSP
uniref:Uncharacterized protein n=1 Tax=Panagrolaimus davidi TaxID=227884 RepID=A0A914PQB0_9BILA